MFWKRTSNSPSRARLLLLHLHFLFQLDSILSSPAGQLSWSDAIAHGVASSGGGRRRQALEDEVELGLEALARSGWLRLNPHARGSKSLCLGERAHAELRAYVEQQTAGRKCASCAQSCVLVRCMQSAWPLPCLPLAAFSLFFSASCALSLSLSSLSPASISLPILVVAPRRMLQLPAPHVCTSRARARHWRDKDPCTVRSAARSGTSTRRRREKKPPEGDKTSHHTAIVLFVSSANRHNSLDRFDHCLHRSGLELESCTREPRIDLNFGEFEISS